MNRIICTLVILLVTSGLAYAQTWSLSGVVLDKKSGEPVEFATVVLTSTEQWAVADAKGQFLIKNIQSGKNVISVSCLGYVTDEREVTITKDITSYKAYLSEDNLTLTTAVVTAQENENSAATSRIMDRTALDHVQLLNVSDISSLLPGGTTVNANLVSEQRFNIRSSSSSEAGNASFGTAVELDGVRLSNNASFSSTTGVTTNNISSSNVESVEVISGVPSVEYGDVGSGIVKINTRKGKTPYMLTFTTNPNTKQVSASKGFGLGESRKGASRGVLNASLEYTNAISNNMSPYTSYNRRQISLNYSNLYNRGVLSDMPLRLSVGASGNIGGYDSESDPDALTGTWSKNRDNSFRGNFALNWLLSRSWITGIDFKGSIVYSDKLEKTCSHYTSASSTAALHGTEEGYFVAQEYDGTDTQEIVLIPRGYRYNVMCYDDKPLSYKLSLKANWAAHFGDINNKVKLGADWNGDKNYGKGQYSEDLSTAPTYREYDYSDHPAMNNFALYLEDNFSIPLGKTRLNLIAGVRGEGTVINGSQYGNIFSATPRFNAKYVIFNEKDRRGEFIRDLSFRAGWGVAVKQPSFAVLYPIPTYKDISVFTPATASDGSTFLGYYIMPRTTVYNPDLVWQRNQQSEIGMEINLGGNKISLTAYYNKTLKSYYTASDYEKFAYNYTDQKALESCAIPASDRQYSIDRSTGVVTVTDKTGQLPSEVLQGTVKEGFISSTYAHNSGSPVHRYGVEWVIDFKRIRQINTDIRIDGSFYGYRSVDKDLQAYCPTAQIMTGDGSLYKYIGWYIGGDGLSNGSEIKRVNVNLTLTTHIPAVRMILSAKVEASLMRYSRYLSEGKDGVSRTYAVEDNSYTPASDPSFKDKRTITVSYPLYYSTYDDPDTLIPFYDKYLWAQENDRTLYNDLTALVDRSYYNYYYSKDYYSPYFSANFSVTKEIGDIASISFYANNFFRNYGKVYSTRTRQYSAVSSFIPSFYYGLTLRLKF